MDLLNDLAAGLLSGLGYAALGVVLLAVGYKVIDWLTPGDLNELVYAQRNRNAALLASSGLLAIGVIVVTAILTSDDSFTRGIADAAGYGLLGIALLAVSFKVVDALTPGDLGIICTDAEPHPAVWVTAVSHLVMGAVLAAAIS
jgi:uncharacterized membrane protein YjfL (UPF0719 family)